MRTAVCTHFRDYYLNAEITCARSCASRYLAYCYIGTYALASLLKVWIIKVDLHEVLVKDAHGVGELHVFGHRVQLGLGLLLPHVRLAVPWSQCPCLHAYTESAPRSWGRMRAAWLPCPWSSLSPRAATGANWRNYLGQRPDVLLLAGEVWRLGHCYLLAPQVS